jgi:predicted oxidoreductase
VTVKGSNFFSDRDVADALIAKGLAADFVAAVEAGDRGKVVALLTKVTRDTGGQTADALADFYLTGKVSLAALKS